MNYRHDYHAGNFADVLKHVILARVIAYMKLKPRPFRVIDTHAGAGRYDLAGAEATKTGEWRDGIARVVDHSFSPPVAELIAPYLDAVAAVNSPGELTAYPGSPRVARHLMRSDDVLIANELRSDDSARLKAEFSKSKNTTVLNIDGWTALKSLLPPKERRGVILIDPPFEERDEFQKLEIGLFEARRRFAEGVFLVWYPIKDAAVPDWLIDRLAASAEGKLLDVRLATGAPFPGLGLTETGVAIVNPPFVLEDELNVVMPELTACLAERPGNRFQIRKVVA